MESVSVDYLDIGLLNPEKIVTYDKWIIDGERRTKHTTIGHLSVDGTSYHKYCGYNKFNKISLPIPSSNEGWLNDVESAQYDYDENHVDGETFEEYLEISKKSLLKWIDEHICNPNVKYFVPKKESCLDKYKNCDLYKTLSNYSIGFVVLISRENNNTFVYGMTRDVLPDNYNGDETILFDELIAKYEPLEVFIGKSVFNEMTDFSGGYGEKWDGNSILLRIGHFNEYRYVYIGTDVFEFVVDEKITKYISSVGNNCVPYPFAESNNYVYDMCHHQKFPIADNVNRAIKGHIYDSDGVNAKKIEIISVASRGTDNRRYSINCDEPETYILASGPFELCANTCDNEELPLVQHINNVLDDVPNENIYCASLQDKLPSSENVSYGYGCMLL